MNKLDLFYCYLLSLVCVCFVVIFLCRKQDEQTTPYYLAFNFDTPGVLQLPSCDDRGIVYTITSYRSDIFRVLPAEGDSFLILGQPYDEANSRLLVVRGPATIKAIKPKGSSVWQVDIRYWVSGIGGAEQGAQTTEGKSP